MDIQESVLALEAKIQAANPVQETVPEPVKIEAPEAAVTEEGDDLADESATSDGVDATAQPHKNKGVGKRINELTREKHEERRAREAAEAELAHYRQLAAQQTNSQPQTQQPTGKPTLEAYGYDIEAFQDARDAWVVSQAKTSWQQEQEQAYAQRQQQERTSTFQSRIAAFEKEQPGAWEAAVSAPLDTTPVMLEAIAESEIGPKLAYYLSQNLDEAHAITRMSPFNQAVAMGRIEARISAPAPSRPANTVTRAPAPAPSIQSGNSPGTPVSKWGIEDHMAEVIRQKKAKYAL